MLAAGSLPPPSAPPLMAKKPHSTPLSLLFPHQSHLPLLPHSLLPNYSSLSLSGRSGFCLFAKKKEKNPTFEMEEVEGFQEEEDVFEFDEDMDFYDEDDEEFDDEEDVEGDEGMLPLHKMSDLLENKPKGFGEGKVYDTALEEKLLQEIEKSLKAQVDNLEKRKKEPRKPKPNNELQEVFKGVPGGIRVRVNSLPKKRNIYRDLKSAFEGVPGIINILPVNSGNKKTRDPACKGLAFVDFKSLADANSFVQMFSGKPILFGKSEKPIKCEILKPLDASDGIPSYGRYNSASEGSLTVLEADEDEDDEDEDDDFEQYNTQLRARGADDFDELVKGLDGKYALGEEEKSENIERIERIESKLLGRASLYEDELKAKKKSEVNSNPYEDELKSKKKSEVNSKPDKKPKQKPNKKASLKPEKKPKLSIPGSAKKLKVREKAKLADVYSRYGNREAAASKEK